MELRSASICSQITTSTSNNSEPSYKNCIENYSKNNETAIKQKTTPFYQKNCLEKETLSSYIDFEEEDTNNNYRILSNIPDFKTSQKSPSFIKTRIEEKEKTFIPIKGIFWIKKNVFIEKQSPSSVVNCKIEEFEEKEKSIKLNKKHSLPTEKNTVTSLTSPLLSKVTSIYENSIKENKSNEEKEESISNVNDTIQLFQKKIKTEEKIIILGNKNKYQINNNNAQTIKKTNPVTKKESENVNTPTTNLALPKNQTSKNIVLKNDISLQEEKTPITLFKLKKVGIPIEKNGIELGKVIERVNLKK